MQNVIRGNGVSDSKTVLLVVLTHGPVEVRGGLGLEFADVFRGDDFWPQELPGALDHIISYHVISQHITSYSCIINATPYHGMSCHVISCHIECNTCDAPETEQPATMYLTRGWAEKGKPSAVKLTSTGPTRDARAESRAAAKETMLLSFHLPSSQHLNASFRTIRQTVSILTCTFRSSTSMNSFQTTPTPNPDKFCKYYSATKQEETGL